VLEGLSVAGLAAVSSAAVTDRMQASEQIPEPKNPNEIHYRETDHIRRFYELARR
jgi:hypothetical protein